MPNLYGNNSSFTHRTFNCLYYTGAIQMKFKEFSESIKTPYYDKHLRSLNLEEISIIERFLSAKIALNPDQFEMEINRLFLDKKEKIKKWTLVCELLSAFNTSRQLK